MKLPTAGAPWLSNLPKDWTVRPLDFCFSERNEKNPQNELPVLSLSYGRVIERAQDNHAGLRPQSFDTYQTVRDGDIVLRLIDLQNDKRSIRVGQARGDGIITSAYVVVAPDSWACPRFAYYFLLTLDITKVYYGLGSGMRQSITFDDLRHVPVGVPSDNYQHLAAAFLDQETVRIDALISEKRNLLRLLDDYKTSQIEDVLVGSDATRASASKWTPPVPDTWEVKRLKHLGQVRSGIAKGKKHDGAQVVELPYMRVANVQDGHIDLSDVATIEVAETEVERYSLMPGDVLLNEGGDYDKLGRGAVWEGEIAPCLHQNHVFAVRMDNPDMAEWVAAITRTAYAKFYFMNNSKQSTNLASISQRNVKEFPVIVPPKEERERRLQQLKEELTKIAVLEDHVRAELFALAELRFATITDAVLGRIDVSAYMPSTEPEEAAA